jgi:hypothetical protein
VGVIFQDGVAEDGNGETKVPSKIEPTGGLQPGSKKDRPPKIDEDGSARRELRSTLQKDIRWRELVGREIV